MHFDIRILHYVICSLGALEPNKLETSEMFKIYSPADLYLNTKTILTINMKQIIEVLSFSNHFFLTQLWTF